MINLPTKTGWYRARWPHYVTWSCVLVTVTGAEVSVYDPDTSRLRPLSDVDEWGPYFDDVGGSRKEIESLRADLRVANATIASLRAELARKGTETKTEQTP